ncbi:MAG: PGPGW domain-containing protein [Verrucomicrobia bacterium]|nr:PGPGW domain-containing protein [Verrucomicrobiota bacterium]
MKHIKRIVVIVVGGTVLAIGVAFIVLPGPAFIVIPFGLAILAVEFAWARRWLHKARELLQRRGGAVEQKEVA